MIVSKESVPPYAERLCAALTVRDPEAIAVYGLGVVARNVLDVLRNFNVVGLMDKDPAHRGNTVYGMTVLDDDQVVSRRVTAIVIAASDVYWRTIAERIAPFCERNEIRIVFLNGKTFGENQLEQPARPPVTVERSELERMIAEHDVVSFDLFETLVTRLVSRPDDLLDLALAGMETDNKQGLLSARKEAETDIRNKYGFYAFSLGKVYSRMQRGYGVSDSTASALYRAELTVEESLSAPRPVMLDLLCRCRAQGKCVCITTDTHLPRESLVAILKRCGLDEVPLLLISWEEGCAKATGELFDVLRSRYPVASILHIGDDERSDVRQARRLGLGAFRVPSPMEVLLSSRLRSLLVAARTPDDGVLLGMVARQLFADPFRLCDHDGRIDISELRNFGYLFLGPVLLVWFAWLVGQLRERSAQKLLFFARDGYLLHRLYNWLKAESGWDDLPEGVYFATSRRMASVASLMTREEVLGVLDDDFSGSSEQLLRLRFGLDGNDACGHDRLVNSDPAALRLVERHMPEILANAREERAAYLKYIQGLGVSSGQCVVVADLGIKGTIQNALQRMLGQTLQGCYITGFFGESNTYGMCQNTCALFPEGGTAVQSETYRYHILWESVLVAPEGMYLRFAENGNVSNAQERMNQSLFDRKTEIHHGIRSLISDWLTTGIGLEGCTLSPSLADTLYGEAMGDGVTLSDSVKDVFYVDECYRAETEKRIWD